jgi:hypothetical protein
MWGAVVVFGAVCSVGCAACDSCRNCRNCGDYRRDLRCVLTNPTGQAASTGRILIESARYGRDDQWVDVTPQVRGLVSGDAIVFPRDLQATLGVDPIPGRMKYVEMTIVIDGRVMEMTVGDSLHVTPLRIHVGAEGGNRGVTTRTASP